VWTGCICLRYQWLALVKTVMNFGVPWGGGDFFSGSMAISFSRRTLLHGVGWLVIAYGLTRRGSNKAVCINITIYFYRVFENLTDRQTDRLCFLKLVGLSP